jgi:hypothetical protein
MLPGPILVRTSGSGRGSAGRVFHFLPAPSGVPSGGFTKYHVYSNGGSGPINYATPVATVTGLSWTSSALAYPADWWFGVRAFNACGEEQNLDCAVELILDAAGHDITNRPPAPTGLRAFALAGGTIRVEWSYPTVRGPKTPTGFHVYIGIGAPNYATPAATVLFSIGIAGSFVSNLTSLTDETTYTIGVRAFNAVAEEPNTVTVSATAEAVGPAAVDALVGVASATA